MTKVHWTMSGDTEFARTYLGVDPVNELVPVYPTCHYLMGGIPTTVHGQVLRDNVTMLTMCRELGFSVEEDRDDRNLFAVSFDLGPAASSTPA